MNETTCIVHRSSFIVHRYEKRTIDYRFWPQRKREIDRDYPAAGGEGIAAPPVGFGDDARAAAGRGRLRALPLLDARALRGGGAGGGIPGVGARSRKVLRDVAARGGRATPTRP